MAQRNAYRNNQQRRVFSSAYSNKAPYKTKNSGLIFTVYFLLILLSGCSTQPTNKSILMQEEKLEKLHIDQNMDDVLSIMDYEKLDYFHIKEYNDLFTFTEVSNPKTNVHFGFFFKNKKLESLILDQDVTSLFACRTRFKTNDDYWIKYGITPYSRWIIARNKLTPTFNKKIANPAKHKEIHPAAQATSNTITAIIYSPFLLIAMPFWFADKITGESTSREEEYDRKLEKRHLERVEKAKEIAIGDNEESIISKLGPPTDIYYVNDTKILNYSKLGTAYGINSNELILIESPSPSNLYTMPKETGDPLYGKEQCDELDNLWISNNQPSN